MGKLLRPESHIRRLSRSQLSILSAIVLAVVFACANGMYQAFPAKDAVEAATPASAEPRLQEGYAGGDSCKECHASIYNSYKEVAMGHSAGDIREIPVIEDYSTTGGYYYHKPSRQHFRMTLENHIHYQERWQDGPRGQKINHVKVSGDFVIGSGTHSRSYLHREKDDGMTMLPIAWYEQEKIWAMNPGYDSPSNPGFTRPILHGCAFCHVAYPSIPPGNDNNIAPEVSVFPHGIDSIDCERCHGPSAEHIKLAQAKASLEKIKSSTLNPANLSGPQQVELCSQCHLETTSSGLPDMVTRGDRGIYSYRPGEPLIDYSVHFDHPTTAGRGAKFEIASQTYRMQQSRCYLESNGKMTCTTCHDPHKTPKYKAEAAITACLECHTVDSCTEKPNLQAAALNNCITCHMPETRTEDVIHVTMHDHAILRNARPASERLAPASEVDRSYKGPVEFYHAEGLPESEKNLYLGMASVKTDTDSKGGLELLIKYLKTNPDSAVAWSFKGKAQKQLGEGKEALNSFQKAWALSPNDFLSVLDVADAQLALQDTDEALIWYQKALELKPDSARPLVGIGKTKLFKKLSSESADAFTSAVMVNPKEKDALISLASISLEQKRYPEAVSAIKRALEIYPSLPDLWLMLGTAIQSAGGEEKQDSIWYAAEALRLFPGDSEAYNSVSYLLDGLPQKDRMKAAASLEMKIPFESAVLQARDASRTSNSEILPLLNRIARTSGLTSNSVALAEAREIASSNGRNDITETLFKRSMELQPHSDSLIVGFVEVLLLRKAGGEAAARDVLLQELSTTDSARLSNTLAFLLATALDESIRDGVQAEFYARQAEKILKQENYQTRDALSAALAAQGKFEQAVEICKVMKDQAATTTGTAMAARFNSRIQLYTNRKLLLRDKQ